MIRTAREPLPGIPEVAAYLRVSEATVRDWIYRDTGPKSAKVGRYRRFTWAEVDRWLASQTSGDPAA